MTFKQNPFDQATDEVKNKSWTDQVSHSKVFHSYRSAFSSKGSLFSKGSSAVVTTGKLFLALIPVPVVGAVVGAVVDKISDVARGEALSRNKAAATTNADKVKFEIKDLTVENLDRYRWKLAHAYEELNAGIRAYNASTTQSCDDLYTIALLIAQVERRKEKLTKELQKFAKVINLVNDWIGEVDVNQGQRVSEIKTELANKPAETANEFKALVNTIPAQAAKMQTIQAAHANCQNWCCIKETAKYEPDWQKTKKWAGKVAMAMGPIAMSAVAVRKQDYTADSSNSSFSG